MFERGALLAERFRVVGSWDAERGLVAADDLAGGRVLLVTRATALSAAEVGQRVEQAARFGLGCPGLARPVAASVAEGHALVAFRMPPYASVAAESAPWPAERVLALVTRLARAVGPLHEQGIGHGSIRAELVFEQGSDVLLGFGAEAARGGAAPEPSSDVSDLAALAARLLGSDAFLANVAQARDLDGFLSAFARALQPPAPAALAAPPAPEPPPLPVTASPPVTAPPPALPPVEQPPPLPATASKSFGLWAALALAFGVILMLGGAAGAFAYVLRRAPRPVASTAPVVTAPAVPAPPAPPPPETTAAPENDDEPEPIKPARPSSAAGVGQSTFPEDARAVLPLRGTDPIWGTRAATVTLLVFGDLQCPHTRRTIRSLAKLKETLGDDLRLVFRHRPLSDHPYALTAARVLAGVQSRHGAGAFYRLLLEIARDETALSAESLGAALSGEGVTESLSRLESLGTVPVEEDLRVAAAFGIASTPFSFVNGARVEGDPPYAELEAMLVAERRAADWSLAAGASAAELYSLRSSVNLIGVGDTVAERSCVPLGASPQRGPSDALVTIVEFADFECPFCKRAEASLSTLLEHHPGKLRLVWKSFPLPQHARAPVLGSFANQVRSAGGEKAFWAVHDALLRHKGAVDDSTLLALGASAGLDDTRATAALGAAGTGHDSSQRADLALGERLNVSGTPTFFFNGRRLSGAQPLVELERVFAEELKTAERFVATGLPPAKLYDRLCSGGR